MDKHAIRQFKALWTRARSRMPSLFFDYDGTLAEIVKKPELAHIYPGMRGLLRDFAMYTDLAVISGRYIHDLEGMVGIKHENISYAGAHGLQIRLKNQAHVFAAIPLDNEREQIKELSEELKTRLHGKYKSCEEGAFGVRIEPKMDIVAVHYREADPAAKGEILAIVDQMTIPYGLLKTLSAKEAVDIRPKASWNKGDAVEYFLSQFRHSSLEQFPIYIGDDITDQDAFRKISKTGIGIYVGRPENKAAAEFFLDSPREVLEFLYALREEIEKASAEKRWGLAVSIP